MQRIILLLFFVCSNIIFSQKNENILTLEEYLGYVKKYHPVVRQAQLVATEGEIKLLKSRGAFDPKLEVDYNRKTFKNNEYYNKLNTSFKIPTWYGLELKASYENNEGVYLNPELNTPKDGLYSIGISMPLAKGLLINKRMATLRQAKIYTKQSQVKQQLITNDVLYSSILSYFKWLKNYESEIVYKNYLANAEIRLQSVKKSFLAGDKPAIDTLEASINLKNRLLDLEKAKISYTKSTLMLSNHLWLENDIPLELKEKVNPDINTINKVDNVLNSSILNNEIEKNPKLQGLLFKKEILTVDKKLKFNNLLPEINLQYNFLSTDYDKFNSLNTSNYKSGLNVRFPLFLRKERAALKLAKLKLKDLDFDIATTKVSIKNKIEATLQEIKSYERQSNLIQNLVIDYKQILKSEERKFILGEGSLFLVNYREVKLIENQLKKIDIEYKLFISKSNLMKILNSF